ncbi:unnamed protein product [Cylindrotheca closterium]|uniref:Myb-like domain-containing protein n=1 Tax=Cylindrotheca closterium TaxID=2856 RepID=A0AAD2FS16_9STRA|nr:unnamed protein product [Cylindrotheca closterium]
MANRGRDVDLQVTTLSLKNALTANRELQKQLTTQLQKILKQKEENRKKAAQCVKELASVDLRQHPEMTFKRKAPNESQIKALFPDEDPFSVRRRRAFRYDENRTWKFEYWTDPTGSTPTENQDTLKRRRFEALDTGQDVTKAKPQKKTEQMFSKTESNLIMREGTKGEETDWSEIAAKLEDRTAFECLKHFHQKIKEGKASGKEKPSQDEVVDATILNYVALHGPQFVWDLPSIAHCSALVGGGKFSHRQLRIRANLTQLNPNYNKSTETLKQFWHKDEERKLVIAMKVYKNQANPIQMASTHFPNRPTPYIAKKWERTLKPKKQRKGRQLDSDDET